MFNCFWRGRINLNADSSSLQPGKRRRPRRFRLGLEPLEDRFLLSTFTVTNTNDSGAGSLRDAITRVDNDTNAGIDTINFAIGSGPQTIAPGSPLPAITHAVIVDGTTQPGFVASPLIELDGANAGTTANGLIISAGGSTVKALVINRFALDGILMLMKGGDTLVGSYIGTDTTGSLALGNGANGVELAGIANNTLGGTTSGKRNLISANALDGVLISGNGNLVQGNRIGTDVTGTVALGNGTAGVSGQGSGVDISGASKNTIGGTTPGARNLISANGQNGVYITGSAAQFNLVQGNFLGTDVTGSFALGNGVSQFFDFGSGVYIKDASSNTVGGTTAGARNLISANTQNGVFIFADTATPLNNVVESNFIGTDVSGSFALGNGPVAESLFGLGSGVAVQGASGNIIGGTTAAARNLISGNNGCGVFIFTFNGPTATKNVVEGNFIGTDASGSFALGNGSAFFGVGNGVEIDDATSNVVGGTTRGARNVIAASGVDGVLIQRSFALIEPTNDLVQGNYVGTDATGSFSLGNHGNAVEIINGNSNTIGGTAAGAGNLLSGNGMGGAQISQAGDGTATGNKVQGNLIGTDFSGKVAVGNAGVGINLVGGSSNLIGGTTAAVRNIISGNGLSGVEILGALQSLVQGNYIGTDITGAAALGNGSDGVAITGGSNNTIGGSASARNIISGNFNVGVGIDAGVANLVRGNYIGTDVTGSVALGNGSDGVILFDPASNNTIGGTTFETRNIISGNGGNGITMINGAAFDMHNMVEGNYIGTDVSGSFALGNLQNGVALLGGADSNTIGGTAFGAGNLISANHVDGVLIGNTASGNHVLGNKIGSDVTGVSGLGNRNDGVDVSGASNNLIGGPTAASANLVFANVADGVFIGPDSFGNPASGNMVQGNFILSNAVGVDVAGSSNTIGGMTSAAGNLISFNSGNGVTIAAVFGGPVPMNNLVEANLIGTDVTGFHGMGNGNDGVFISGANNTIGGTTAGTRNLISSNSQAGVALNGTSSTGNLVEGNFIGTDITGTLSLPNFNVGVTIFNGAVATVGGTTPAARNLISGNAVAGVYIQAVPGSLVEGNYIGTDVTGTLALPNNGYGVAVFDSSGVTVGGTSASPRNIISSNASIDFFTENCTGLLVAGNYLGTNASGTQTLGGTTTIGIELFGASNNTIGGTTSGAANVIAGTSTAGILLSPDFMDNPSNGNVLEGNKIGTNAQGTSALANGAGLIIQGNSNNTVGGTATGAGNLISGNLGDGISLQLDPFGPGGANGAVVQGNKIGTDITGMVSLANGRNGVTIDGSNNSIGGSATGAGNIIAFNTGTGVFVDSGTGNLISRNSIFNNGAQGIILNTANNANNSQAAPTLTSAVSAGGTITIQGTLTSTPNTLFTIEFFVNPTADPSGFGQGETFLGAITVTTNASGTVSFTASFASSAPPVNS
jgi:hypothetical protein